MVTAENVNNLNAVMNTEMQSNNIEAPVKFEFEKPSNWNTWRKRFMRYLTISGLARKPEEEKIDVLLYVMGEKSEEILLQFPEIPDTLEGVLDKFTGYFTPKVNVIFERFLFNTRLQRDHETVNDFIIDLHKIAETCKFGTLKEELIRDRIAVGIQNKKVSENLQLKSDLTLNDAILIVKRAEDQEKQTKIMLGSQTDSNYEVNKIKKSNISSRKCYFCGVDYNNQHQCPARDATCFKCGRIGHFSSVCRSNDEKNKQSKSGKKQLYINWEQIQNVDKYSKNIYVREFSKEVNFLIDTGSDIDCLPMSIISPNLRKTIKNTNVTIKAANNRSLKIFGVIYLNLSYNNIVIRTELFVIDGLTKPIVGKNTIEKFSLLKILSIDKDKQFTKVNPCAEFPKIFKNIGEFKEEVSIKLKENAKPFAQTVPRNVPIPRLDALKKELTKLEELEIISSIQEPTEWVAPIVVVPKDNNDIRLCVDFTRLDEHIFRPYFPITSPDAKFAKIGKAKYFSKIDLNKGFHQIKLKEDCQKLTTFITPFGRYYYKRLPFGISMAPEEFVGRFYRVLQGIQNIIFHVDEVLIFGADIESHDDTLSEVLLKLSKEGLTINKEKSIFGVEEIEFLGSVLSSKGVTICQNRIKAIKEFPRPKDKKELQRFLGMINFVSKYIQNRADILEPLYALLKNNVPYLWDHLQENSFKLVKDMIEDAIPLGFFNKDRKTYINTDASSYGIGAYLYQINKEGQLYLSTQEH